MNKLAASVFASCATLLTSCQSSPRFDAGFDEELLCLDRRVAVTHSPAQLDVRPPDVGVCRERTLTFRIAPPVEPNGARTISEDAEWLNRESTDGRTITIEVPESAPLNVSLKYTLILDGVGALDPRVTIIR